MSQGTNNIRRGDNSDAYIRSLTSRTQVRGSFAGVGNASTTTTVPFLTNVENHFGRVTLTAPDNMRRTKKKSRQGGGQFVTSDTGARSCVQVARSSAQSPVVELEGGARQTGTSTRGGNRTRRTRSNADMQGVSRHAMASRELNRRVNVWDGIEEFASIDEVDPPPPFAVESSPPNLHPTAEQTLPQATHPRSPPPAFVSDEEHTSEDEHDAALPPSIDPIKLRESDAWERDRLLGYSLEERVARMERRRAGQPHPTTRNTISSVITQPETLQWNRSTAAGRIEPRDPSNILHVARAPARLSQPTPEEDAQATADSSDDDDLLRRNGSENSDEEWESEQNALQSLYRYEANMRRMWQDSRVCAHRNSPRQGRSTEPSVPDSAQESERVVQHNGDLHTVEAPSISSRLAPTVSDASEEANAKAFEAPADQPAHSETGSETNARFEAENDSLSTSTRPLPPPPPSQVPFIRSAYDQLRELQVQNRLPATLRDDVASLEAYLSRYETPTDAGALPLSVSHFGGAFTNARSSAASLPRQSRLPVVTDATRHFPRSGQSSGLDEESSPIPQHQVPISLQPARLAYERAHLSEQPDETSAEAPQVLRSASQSGASQVPAPEVQAPSAPQPIPPASTIPEETLLRPAPAIPLSAPQLAAPVSEDPTATGQARASVSDTQEGGVVNTAQPSADQEVTDLEVAVAHLDHPSAQYEWATLISDFLGPAQQQTQSTEALEHVSVGRVELAHRRVTSSGQVRVRLTVAGIRVDRCGICLEQFREGQRACILPCFHMYVQV